MPKAARFIVITAAIALLAGCGGSNQLQTSPAQGAPPMLERASVAAPGLAVRRSTSSAPYRVSPNPCCVQMLFVSDAGANQVQRYKFPNGNYQGALPPPPETFNLPQGECVDVNTPQHVFVANTNQSTIDEYTHSGVYVTHLLDTGEYPVSCAYRQTGASTGELAVGNIIATNGSGGSVSVYTVNAGVWTGPTTYVLPGFERVYFLSYKGSKLFLDLTNSSVFNFYAMSQTGNFTPINVNSPCQIVFPGGVQSIGNYLAVGDQTPSPGCPNIYHVLPTGVVTGATTLTPAPSDIAQFFRLGGRVVGPDGGAANADIYSYPAGALLTNVTAPGLIQPIGSAVSQQ